MIECVAWLASIESDPRRLFPFKKGGGVPVHNEPDLYWSNMLYL